MEDFSSIDSATRSVSMTAVFETQNGVVLIGKFHGKQMFTLIGSTDAQIFF